MILIRCFVFVCVIGKLCAIVSNTLSCDGETVIGNVINVRYPTCNADGNGVCIVKPSFTGGLRFTSTTNKSNCHTKVNISDNIDPNTTFIMPCGNRASTVFTVTPTTVLSMLPKTVNFAAVKFYQEIRIYRDKIPNGTISVTCRNKTTLSTFTRYGFGTDDISLSTTLSSTTVPVGIQPPNKDSDIIFGLSGVVVVLIIVICVLVYFHIRRKHKKTNGRVEEYLTVQTNASDRYEIPDYPPHYSNQPLDAAEYSTIN